MADPFETSKHSIAWAKEHHLAELKRKLATFFDQNSNSTAVVTERDPHDGTYNLVKLRLVKPMPRDFAGHTVDIINNLLSALDQAVFAIASKPGYFPIRNTKAEFDGAVKDLKKRVPKEIVRLVRSFKPYKRGNKSLWVLKKLSNTHKHAIIRPVGTGHALGAMTGEYRGPRPPQFPFPTRWNRAKNEVVIARVPTDVEKFKMEYSSSFSIVFSNVKFVKDLVVLDVLDDLVSVTERVVMGLEAEAKRIGLI